MKSKKAKILLILLVVFLFISTAFAEDGYRLWLRYDALPQQNAKIYQQQIKSIVVGGKSETSETIREELKNGLNGLLSKKIPNYNIANTGAVVVGTPQTFTPFSKLKLPLSNLGNDGFLIQTVSIDGQKVIAIVANTEIGTLYGTFHFLRLLQTLQPISNLNIIEKPKIQLRMLNHWDNLDGSIERGYAGKSLWNWAELPDKVDPRYRDYARTNASIGINAVSLNNVNANAQILTPEYLKKVAAIANVFRPYGIKVYLSARFSAPMELGGLKTADPFDQGVKDWWKQKTAEIYQVIPDFGGFLVKANSEGQPGPRTYDRNHVDGANMMAEALKPFGGIVIWRAFVYDMKPGYDRAGAAYENLQPFDGKFAPNVLLQAKNGPIDFQPREPFHPLFGAMPKTNLMPEFQITQEYLGFSNHLVFLADMWREVLEADTFAKGKGSTVAKVADGSLFKQKMTGIAGVANTGTDRNWTGYDFLQANWYAFGRLAWNHEITSRQIADEWTKMTLTRQPKSVALITKILLESHNELVNYMTPLGLHHQMWGGHHYGPAPWWNTYSRDDWNPTYYNKADEKGIGFDRTKKGSNTVSQYFPAVRDEFSNLKTIPEKYLLWFQHVPWDYKMKSGKTLWVELALHYQEGVNWARRTRKDWEKMKGIIDNERYAAIAKKLAIQERDAIWWKDASLSYFQSLSKLPLPNGVEKPQKTLEEYKKIDLLDDFARGIGNFDENHK
ncbi:MAG TPA: alpha-glucuronidase family glycosyl hydrolase [Pyrinomonadaceae bacterium]|nr:alpha-glucuronidase family glycosyl hydrolase [Pyrinomonadaceae bacterium]